MRKRVCLWLGGVALVALALLLTDWLLWQPGLTEDNVCRIKSGMTLAKSRPCWAARPRTPWRCPPTYRRFGGSGSGARGGEVVVVQFFADGTVMTACGGRRSQPGPLARLRAWLGW